jgi:hypothetical protein
MTHKAQWQYYIFVMGYIKDKCRIALLSMQTGFLFKNRGFRPCLTAGLVFFWSFG